MNRRNGFRALATGLVIATASLCALFDGHKAHANYNTPDGPHPRIWLTGDEISRLTAKRDQKISSWSGLITWCDAHLNDLGYDTDPTNQSYDLTNWGGNNNYVAGYRMSGFALHLMNYALAYQVLKAPGSGQNLTKALSYAARVRTLMIKGIAQALRSGEEANGLKALRVGLHDATINAAEGAALGFPSRGYKDGYSSRFLAAVPIAYDWIYDTLAQSDKDVLVPMMLRWFDWIRGVRSNYNNGVLISGNRYHEDRTGDCTGINICTSFTGVVTLAYDYGNMSGNFNGGHTSLMSLIPVAIYGDNPDAPNYLSAFRGNLANTVVDQLESDLKHSGGDSVEGWNYGGGFYYSVAGLYGYFTATQDDTILNMKFPADLVRSMLYRVSSQLSMVPNYGYWTGTPLGVNRKYMAQTFVGVLQRLHPEYVESSYGQYFMNHATFLDTLSQWESFLWPRTDILEAPLAQLPLSRIAKGNGFFMSKSSWTDSNAVHLAVRLEGKVSAAHEGYDEGDFSIIRGQDRLISHSNAAGESPPASSFSSVIFNNANHHGANPAMTRTAIDRAESGTGYSYVSGDISNAFKRIYKTTLANLVRRSVLHLLPGHVIVYDITQSNPTVGNLKEWQAQFTASPTVSTDSVSAVNGNSAVFVKTLYPTGGTYTVTNPYSGNYRVKYTPAVLQQNDQFLHFISATASSETQAASVALNATNMRGVHIQDGTVNTIALFTSDKAGAPPSGVITYSYTPTALQTNHFITDLTPGQGYDVAISGSGTITVTLTPNVNSQMKASNSGGILGLSVYSDNTYMQFN